MRQGTAPRDAAGTKPPPGQPQAEGQRCVKGSQTTIQTKPLDAVAARSWKAAPGRNTRFLMLETLLAAAGGGTALGGGMARATLCLCFPRYRRVFSKDLVSQPCCCPAAVPGAVPSACWEQIKPWRGSSASVPHLRSHQASYSRVDHQKKEKSRETLASESPTALSDQGRAQDSPVWWLPTSTEHTWLEPQQGWGREGSGAGQVSAFPLKGTGSRPTRTGL